MISDSLTPLLEPLAALQRLIDRFQGKGIVIGDIAASFILLGLSPSGCQPPRT